MHNASKVLMGSTQSSDKPGTDVYASDPATYLAGLAVRLASTGLLSITKAAGRWAGVSLGRSLSDHKKTCVLRAGLRTPVLLELAPARGEITITDYAKLVSGTDDSVTVGATAFTFQTDGVTPTQATAQAATSNAATATSLAAQINAHATAGALVNATVDPNNSAKVIVTAKGNTTAGNSIALAYTDNDVNIGLTLSGTFLEDGGEAADFVVIGQPVYFSDVTGKADDPNSAATVSGAVYQSEPMTGIDEDGNDVAIALVDFVGGL